MRYLLFAVLLANGLLRRYGGDCRPPPKEQVEEFGSVANFSRESVEPYDPYHAKSNEIHIPPKNETVLNQYVSKWYAMHPTTEQDPYDEPHYRLVSVFNNNPKPLTVYKLSHWLDDGSTPYPAFGTQYYDFVIPPYTWSKNSSIHSQFNAHEGKDEFSIILGYEGRNMTSKQRIKVAIPRMLPDTVELIKLFVNVAKDEFIVKPQFLPARKTQFIEYVIEPLESESFERGGYHPL